MSTGQIKKLKNLKKSPELAVVKVKVKKELDKIEIKQEIVHFKRSKEQTKKPQILTKSPGSASKAKVKVEKIEIMKEFKDAEVGRITRSQNKNSNFASFFDFEVENASEFDGNSNSNNSTSTTASFDGEDNDKDQDISKSMKMLKSCKIKQIKLEEPVANSDSDEYLCSVCHESFTTKIHAKNHEKNCTIVRIGYRKGKCNIISNLKPKLDDLEIQCEYENCKYTCSTVGHYNQHIDMMHTKVYVYDKHSSIPKNCFLCRKKFKLKAQLEEHMKIPHKIKCPECAMIFVEPAQLDRHRSFSHRQELKEIQCPKCPKKFIYQINMRNHMSKVHVKKMTVCPFCSEEILKYSLARHLETHNEGGPKKSFCEICQVYLTNRNVLRKHLKTTLHLDNVSEMNGSEEFILPHDINTVDSNSTSSRLKGKDKSDEGIFDPVKNKNISKNHISLCHDCGVKFRNYHYRDAHREKYHGVQRPVNHCTICDRNFTRNSVLKNHENSMTHKLKEKELLQANQTSKK